MVGLLFTSCKKKDNNNSTSYKQPTVSYKLMATNTDYIMAKTTALANIHWTSGFANPDMIKFDATKDNASVEFTSTNSPQVDIMSSVATDFGGFTLPAGTYDRVSLKIRLDSDGPSPSLQLNGQFVFDSLTLPVMLQVNESVELQTEQNNVTISGDSAFIAVTTLDLSGITSGITSTMLLNAQLTNGTIVISSNSNHDLYHTILTNLGVMHHHCEFEHHHH